MRHLFRNLVVTGLIALTACANIQRSDTALAAKHQMIGLSREQVLACMGPAKKKASEGATEVWSYLSTDASGQYSSHSIKPLKGITDGAGSHSRNFCFVNVVMKDGRVTAVHYNGPTSDSIFAPDEQCGYAVSSCVGGGVE